LRTSAPAAFLRAYFAAGGCLHCRCLPDGAGNWQIGVSCVPAYFFILFYRYSFLPRRPVFLPVVCFSAAGRKNGFPNRKLDVTIMVKLL